MVERGREAQEPPRTVTGKYDRGLGWEELHLEIDLVGARTVSPRQDLVQGPVRRGRWIAARFRARNRGSDASDRYPHLVAVDENGRPYHSGSPERALRLEPSFENLRVPPQGRRDGYLSVQVPERVPIDRLELKLFGQSLGWDLDHSL